MTEKRDRAPAGSLWGNFDESARFVREKTETERVTRDAKTHRLKEARLAKHSDDSGKVPRKTPK